MFQSYNDGFCPQCALDGEDLAMLLNRTDYWECPRCRLQAAGSGGSITVLRQRGTGDFKSHREDATRYVIGALISRQRANDPFTMGAIFTSEEDFRRYLSLEVTEAT